MQTGRGTNSEMCTLLWWPHNFTSEHIKPCLDDHATGTNGSPPACAAVKYSMCAVCRCKWLWGACRWCSSHVYFYFLRGKDACSHHAEHINSKLSPPVGCWFWVVPRSMLLEALTCWNCRWFWFWVGDWGWAGLEVWEFSLEQIDEAVTVVGRVLTSSELW